MSRVKCYPLSAVLDAAQMEAVRPFLRATFTETWAETTSQAAKESGSWARAKLREAAGVPMTPGTGYVDDARPVERALYRRAARLGATPVMAKGRGR